MQSFNRIYLEHFACFASYVDYASDYWNNLSSVQFVPFYRQFVMCVNQQMNMFLLPVHKKIVNYVVWTRRLQFDLFNLRHENYFDWAIDSNPLPRS